MVFTFPTCGVQQKQLACGAIVWNFAKHKAIWLSVKAIVNGMKTYLRKAWRVWAKALGEKSGATEQEADRVALVRTAIVLCYIITNVVIVAGVIRHW
jgi:hypothetical protein